MIMPGAGHRRALDGVHADAAAADDDDRLAATARRRRRWPTPSPWSRRSRRGRPCRGGCPCSILMQDDSAHTVYSPKVPMQHMMPRSWPSLAWWRAVKSVTWRPARRKAPRSQRFWRPRAARGAASAGRDEAEHHVVADLEGGDAGPDLDDLAGAFVAADDRELLDAELVGDGGVHHHVAGEQVLVGVAQPGADELQQHLARPWAGRGRSPRRSTSVFGSQRMAARVFMSGPPMCVSAVTVRSSN